MKAALQKARDRRVEVVLRQPAQTLGNAGVILGKFLGALIQKRKLAVEGVDEIAVHPRTVRFDTATLPAPGAPFWPRIPREHHRPGRHLGGDNKATWWLPPTSAAQLDPPGFGHQPRLAPRATA